MDYAGETLSLVGRILASRRTAVRIQDSLHSWRWVSAAELPKDMALGTWVWRNKRKTLGESWLTGGDGRNPNQG
jgi:hypothetical protein